MVEDTKEKLLNDISTQLKIMNTNFEKAMSMMINELAGIRHEISNLS